MRYFIIIIILLLTSCEKEDIIINKKITTSIDSLYKKSPKVNQEIKKKRKLKRLFRLRKSQIRELKSNNKLL